MSGIRTGAHRPDIPTGDSKPGRWWRWLEVGVPAVVIAATASLQLAHGFSLVPPRLSTLLGGHSVASPFFSMAAFRSVKPGMTEAEVRDLLGYPLERVDLVTCVERPDRMLWIYTEPQGDRKGWFRHCLVTFDPHTHRVLRTRERDSGFSPGMVRPWAEQLEWEVGSVCLSGGGSETLRLVPDREKPCLVVLDPGWSPLQTSHLPNNVSEHVRSGLTEAHLEGMDVAVLWVEDALMSEGECSTLPRVKPESAYTSSQPPFGPLGNPYCLLYHRGTLYALPAIGIDQPAEDWAPDVAWLLNKLKTDDDGR